MSKMEHFPQHSQDSEHQPLAKVQRDVWAPLGYDTKIDVFKFLRPYDIRKFCVNVNKYWLEFCVENRNYLPTPRIALRRTVEQCTCSDEMKDFDQRVSDECHKVSERNRERRETERRIKQHIRRRTCLFYLTFSAMLLVSWSCITYLTVKMNHQSKKYSTDDLVALFFLLVIGFMMTHQLRAPETKDSWQRRHRRGWFSWLCFRVILGLAGLTFSYVFPHITPSSTVLWITLTVIHIPEWGVFFSWINRLRPEFCLLPSFNKNHRIHYICPIFQRTFVFLLFIPQFAALFATFFVFHPSKTISFSSLTVITLLTSIVIKYKNRYSTFYGLCLKAIAHLFPTISFPIQGMKRWNMEAYCATRCCSGEFRYSTHCCTGSTSYYYYPKCSLKTVKSRCCSITEFPYYYVWNFSRLAILGALIMFEPAIGKLISIDVSIYVFWIFVISLYSFEILWSVDNLPYVNSFKFQIKKRLRRIFPRWFHVHTNEDLIHDLVMAYGDPIARIIRKMKDNGDWD